jgi:hypothetical protein
MNLTASAPGWPADAQQAAPVTVANGHAPAPAEGRPAERAAGTFTCCETPMPWPARTEDRICPEYGTVWEHDGVDLGAGARIKPQDAPAASRPTGSFELNARRTAAAAVLADYKAEVASAPLTRPPGREWMLRLASVLEDLVAVLDDQDGGPS